MKVRTIPGFIAFCGVVWLSILAAGSVRAQSDTPRPNVPVMQLSMLNDRGGVATPGPDGLPLYQRFTQMVLFAFSAEAENGGNKNPLPFIVRAPQKNTAAEAQSSVRYVLEGDLSASGKDVGPYLCVLRLRDTQAAGGAQVIGQWAGTARTLRDLSGNLARDSRVHTLGLAGELVHQASAQLRQRIASEEAMASYDTFSRRVQEGESDKLMVEAIPEGSMEPVASIPPGTAYRLRITTQIEGRIAIFSLADPAHPVAAFAQELGKMPDVSRGTPLLLPAKQPLIMEVGKSAPVFVAVLTKTSYEDLLLPRSRDGANPPAVIVIDALPNRIVDVPTDPLVLHLLTLWQMRKTNPISSAPLTILPAPQENKVP